MNLSKSMILQGLRRLGELANAENIEIELVIVGGTVMVLEFNTRSETEDVDVILSKPADWQIIQYLAVKVAAEYKWDVGWMNSAAKIFYMNPPPTKSKLLFSSPGIVVYRPPLELIAARKLSLTRSDKSATDWDDAEKLLRQLRIESPKFNKEDMLSELIPFVSKNELHSFEKNFQKMWKGLYNE